MATATKYQYPGYIKIGDVYIGIRGSTLTITDITVRPSLTEGFDTVIAYDYETGEGNCGSEFNNIETFYGMITDIKITE